MLWILHCLITVCFGLPVLWLILASSEPQNSRSLVQTAFRHRTILTLQDIALDSLSSPETLCVQIKVSKTDPFQKGTFILIGLGKYPLCAIRAVVSYLSVRGDSPGPLFQLQSGQPLSCQLLTSWLCQIVASAGLPGNFSSHSFRIGAATVAARQGIPDHLIQALGRWTSNAYPL